MRRPLLGLLAAALVLVPVAGASADYGEPVSISVDMPAVVASNVGFPLHVTVTSDPGLLTGSYRVRVRAARECGGSFDTTPGAVLLDKQLGPNGEVAASGRTHTFGTFTACAFLEQVGDNRLFAFDDSTTFAVTHPCTTYSRRVVAATRSLKKVRKALRHAHGAHRQALSRRASHLEKKLRKAKTGRKRACKQ
ncbi:MAG TPA: hypothetical protein VH817_20740 [Thermoleophilaceae bacterium]|jgi:hypothetical protein